MAALGASGCLPILDLGRFEFGDDPLDGGPRDGGPRDGGPDAGPRDAGCPTPITYYLDGDGDGHGDPATAVEACTPPSTAHITQGGDCDDADDAIHPGAAEVCDAVDQDCDGAIDEGLLRPLGRPIVVEPDLGFGSARAAHTAHQSGYAVVWRTARDATVWASFYDAAGTPAVERAVVEAADSTAGPPREPSIVRHESDGAERLFIAYLQTSSIGWTLYTTGGTGSGIRDEIIVPADSSDLTLARVGERIAIVWTAAGSAFLATLHPLHGGLREPLEIPLPSSATQLAVASVAGPEPYVLLSTYGDAPSQLFRIRDVSPLTAEDLGPLEPDDVTSRCASIGGGACQSGGFVTGMNATPDGGGLILVHSVSTSEGATGIDVRAYGLRPRLGALPPEIVRDSAILTSALLVARHGEPVRGSVASFMLEEGGALGASLYEIPLTALATGAPPYTLDRSDELTLAVASMYRNRGAFLGSARSEPVWNAALLRVGCPP